MSEKSSIHQFKMRGAGGQEVDFGQYVGKSVLVVNVASECGYTPQYGVLQELYETHQDKLAIVGIPCNDFGGQEPGTKEEIISFCQKNYGVSFPITEKVQIINPPPHAIYQWLCQQAKELGMVNTVDWNFHKFLLDGNGALVGSYPSAVSPIDDEILDKL